MRELATQSMLGAFMRMAMLKDGVGSGSEIVRIVVVTQSVTVLEQFLRLILELDIDEKARGKGRVVIKSIEGIEAAIAMSEARFKSSMSGFQSEAAVRRMAAEAAYRPSSSSSRSMQRSSGTCSGRGTRSRTRSAL